MSRYQRPDYKKIYPNVEISDEVLLVLKQSDRQMEYQEYGRKCSRSLRDKFGNVLKDENGQPIKKNGLEVSIEMLTESGMSFVSNVSSAEQVYLDLHYSELDELYSCIHKLSDYEYWIIQKISFESMTQKEIGGNFT